MSVSPHRYSVEDLIRVMAILFRTQESNDLAINTFTHVCGLAPLGNFVFTIYDFHICAANSHTLHTRYFEGCTYTWRCASTRSVQIVR